MLRPFVISDEIKQQFETLKKYADLHPYSMDDLLDVMNGAKPSAGDADPNLMLALPFGYNVAFTYELQPAGKIRHLSVSVDTPGQLPNPAVVDTIMMLLGFESTLAERKAVVALEQFRPGHEAVNVLEKVT